MELVELYPCIQSEGRLTGKTSILLRSVGCNLRCSWTSDDGVTTICDTPFTSWHPEKSTTYSAQEIIQKCKEFPKIEYVIISGGEPFMQKDLAEVTNLLIEEGYHITIETNGTLFNHKVNCDLFSCSPKLWNSVPAQEPERSIHLKNDFSFELLAKNLAKFELFQLKFVFAKVSDEGEIQAFITKLRTYTEVDNTNVYLMPQGISSEELNKTASICQQICIKQGWSYSDRIHIRIYGDKRGV